MSRHRLTLLASVVGLLASAPGSAATLKVFAAASLTDAFREIAAVYEKAHPGDTVELSLAGSQVLRTQIEQGARADVFASADLDHAEVLRRGGHLGSHRVFARNELVVVAPAGGKVARLGDLARPGLKLVVAGSTVPVGRYTTQTLGKLAAAGLYGDDFQARVTANVVSQETNVRIVLSKVALGEADAGFVYVTDARTAPGKVETIEIPDRYNVVAQYPIGVLAASAAPEAAAAFVALVVGPEGTEILRRFGFEIP